MLSSKNQFLSDAYSLKHRQTCYQIFMTEKMREKKHKLTAMMGNTSYRILKKKNSTFGLQAKRVQLQTRHMKDSFKKKLTIQDLLNPKI